MLLNYNTKELHELLSSFFTLTKIRIVVFDDQFNKIVEIPENDCDFCNIVRENTEINQKCLSSDKSACLKCKETNQIHSYVCHIGLTETVAPVFHNDLVIGYLMFGQVLNCSDKEPYWAEIFNNCENYNINIEKLKKAYNKMNSVPLAHIYAAAQIMEACAGYLWLNKYIILTENTFINQFESFISQNLHADLSVDTLCCVFKISRSKLYKILNEYYGTSVKRIIRSKRVKRAKELLGSTSEAVSEVAYKVGYPDYNYFIKVFKAETGITPGQCRKKGVD